MPNPPLPVDAMHMTESGRLLVACYTAARPQTCSSHALNLIGRNRVVSAWLTRSLRFGWRTE
jgi:hypothetical protein